MYSEKRELGALGPRAAEGADGRRAHTRRTTRTTRTRCFCPPRTHVAPAQEDEAGSGAAGQMTGTRAFTLATRRLEQRLVVVDALARHK